MTSKILCVIPARSGSKRLPNKNIKLFHGKPLISHTIEQAKKVFDKEQIIVNSDSDKCLSIAKTYGVEQYRRPFEYAQDNIKTFEVLKEMMKEFTEIEMVVLLQVTSPTRKVETIRNCIRLAHIEKSNVDTGDGQVYVWWTDKPWTEFIEYNMPYEPDIDTQLDFDIAELLFERGKDERVS